MILIFIRMKILSEKRIELSQTITSVFNFIKDGEGMSALRLAGQIGFPHLHIGSCWP